MVLCSLLAVALGFLSFTGNAAINAVARTGYWFELAAFLLFLRALWVNFAEELRRRVWRSADWPTAALIVVCGTILLVHETPGFKIIMDEIMLLGTSMSMHFDRSAVTPLRGNDVQGAFMLMDGIVDKRPLFFPFLLSVLHDLSGYRPSNVFVLNGVLGYVFLWLVSVVGRLMAGRPGAWFSVLLFAGLPLLSQNALGGGFELLNLVMALATLLSAVRFVQRRDENSLSLLVLCALLLCQTRYESVLIAAPAALLILWVWKQEGRLILSWPVVFAPLLMLPAAWQLQIFETRNSAWELASQPGFLVPFSLSYLPDNLAHAGAFFFAKPSDHPSSLLFSILGWVSVPFSLLYAVKQLPRLAKLPAAQIAALFFMIGLIAQFVLMMVYFYGRFDEPIIRRLSLPAHLWLLISLLFVIPQFLRTERPRWALVALAGLGMLALGIPSMALHAYSQEYLPAREVAWRRQFMGDQQRQDYLVIDNDTALWVSHRISATSVERAKAGIDVLQFHLRNRSYSGIYVFQRLEVHPVTGAVKFRDGDDLGPEFVLETVREERLQTLRISRMSRVVELRKGDKSVREGRVIDAPVVPTDPDVLEKARRAYIEHYLKQLP
jgi:hypothetical protein